jgi:hypothetical protein
MGATYDLFLSDTVCILEKSSGFTPLLLIGEIWDAQVFVSFFHRMSPFCCSMKNVSLYCAGKKKTTARAATGSGSRDTLVEDQEAMPVISAPAGSEAQELETTYVLAYEKHNNPHCSLFDITSHTDAQRQDYQDRIDLPKSKKKFLTSSSVVLVVGRDRVVGRVLA